MTIKRFGGGSDLDYEALILFENFGITVYLAQLYEGFLSNFLPVWSVFKVAEKAVPESKE